MPSYLKRYLTEIESRGEIDLAESIENTSNEFTHDYLNHFSFSDHEIGLLFGNIQAGKTSQMFGIICAAADASFPLFIVLTTDSVTLQKQTFERVVNDLSCCDFCICGEKDKQKFIENRLRKPAVIVIKKNSKVLLQWYNTLASSSFVNGNSLFVVDDEADAASPNTLINKSRVSTINSRLTNIRNASIGSVYLQVTGTPQALLLQSTLSNFRPSFTCYFAPGSGYLGGEFFFGDDKSHIYFIDDYTSSSGDALYHALLHHLVASAILFMRGEEFCNFVVHPGVRKAEHVVTAHLIEERLRYIKGNIHSDFIAEDINAILGRMDLEQSRHYEFFEVHEKIVQLISNQDGIKLLLMNADNNISEKEYTVGCNIIIGGNVLGRGVTFPKLQTLYYTRTAKKPQADTMWQHSRMFGYDRDPELMAVYLTKDLYKLFSDINSGNNSIISQVEKGLDKIQLFYPEGLHPTRKNVIDMKMVDIVAGGANYYPNDPANDSVQDITRLLSSFNSEGYYQIGAKLILEVFSHITPSDDFNQKAFVDVIRAMIASNPGQQAILIVRRGRSVTKGTGSLLSPNDRELGSRFTDKPVLTMYQIEGNMGWKEPNLWVPNIKLPDFYNYYNMH